MIKKNSSKTVELHLIYQKEATCNISQRVLLHNSFALIHKASRCTEKKLGGKNDSGKKPGGKNDSGKKAGVF